MAKKKENFLDYIPRHNKRFSWEIEEDGSVMIRVVNIGFFHWITQLLLRKPRISYIHLDEFGSFVWEQINGERTVYEIGLVVQERFGGKAEPLYERLVKFITILRNNTYVVYTTKAELQDNFQLFLKKT